VAGQASKMPLQYDDFVLPKRFIPDTMRDKTPGCAQGARPGARPPKACTLESECSPKTGIVKTQESELQTRRHKGT
jgi:hypothetical protein